MQRTLKVVVATTLSLGFLVGCGTTVRPFVRTGGSGAASGGSPGGQLSPRPDSDRASRDDAQPIVDEICRSEPMRAGWIATRYLRDAGNCAASTDPENPYTAAVIERYSHLPVGSTMVVCADQTIPRQWVRDANRDVRATCDGARVHDGVPTVMVIRRVSSTEY